MGGKAFEGTRRVTWHEVQATVIWLEDQLGFHRGPLQKCILGSGQAASDCGDIDLNMDWDLWKMETLHKRLKKFLPDSEIKYRPGNNQIFTKVPVQGNKDHGFVQVDFMFGDYDWQRFSYFSPGVYSKFKGLYRTELIKAAVAFNSDWVAYEGNELIARVGPTFFHDRGCVWRYRHRPMRKDGKGRVKQFEELSKDEFLALYPKAVPASRDKINKPEQVYELIFDDVPMGTIIPLDENDDDLLVISLRSFDKYEGLHKALKYHYDPNSYAQILRLYRERLNSLKVEIPQEILDEMDRSCR